MTFEKLEKNLMDVIQEEQAKLGFRREKLRPLGLQFEIFLFKQLHLLPDIRSSG